MHAYIVFSSSSPPEITIHFPHVFFSFKNVGYYMETTHIITMYCKIKLNWLFCMLEKSHLYKLCCKYNFFVFVPQVIIDFCMVKNIQFWNLLYVVISSIILNRSFYTEEYILHTLLSLDLQCALNLHHKCIHGRRLIYKKKHRFNTIILFYGILLELILSNLNVNLNFGLIMMNNCYLGRFFSQFIFYPDELN